MTRMSLQLLVLVTIALLLLLVVSAAGGRYDSSTTQFNPSGRILQVEHAKSAIGKGSPAVAVKCSDGIIVSSICNRRRNSSAFGNSGGGNSVASDSDSDSDSDSNSTVNSVVNSNVGDSDSYSADNRAGSSTTRTVTSTSYDHSDGADELVIRSTQKVFPIDSHVLIVATGLLFDALSLVKYAQSYSMEYRDVYNSKVPVEILCEELACRLHEQTMNSGSRPLGVGLIVAGYDELLGYQLYSVDPEGSYNSWKAVAIGQKAESLMQSLIDLAVANTTEIGHSYRNNDANTTIAKSTNSVDGEGNCVGGAQLQTVEKTWDRYKQMIVHQHFFNKLNNYSHRRNQSGNVNTSNSSVVDSESVGKRSSNSDGNDSDSWEVETLVGWKNSDNEFQWTVADEAELFRF